MSKKQEKIESHPELFISQYSNIELPEAVEVKRIGGNKIRQVVRRVGLFECSIEKVGESSSCCVLRGTSGLRIGVKWGSGASPKWKVDGDLQAPKGTTIQNVSQTKNLRWRKPLKSEGFSPEQVSDSWEQCVRLPEDCPEKDKVGLREPQIGAIHAACAHLTLSTKPGTVVMPTGTGKTETMFTLIAYKQMQRVLILVPSNILREQIAEKMLRFGCLEEIGVLKGSFEYPLVTLLEKGVREESEVREILKSSNVIVATPNILKASGGRLAELLCSGCDALFVDEAHHVAAKTWSNVKGVFEREAKPVIQFYCDTVLGNDGKSLEGQVIYNYPMTLAQKNGYF